VKKQIIISLSLLLLVGCGGGSSSTDSSENSFNSKTLYSFKLNFVEHRQRYDLSEIDGVDSSLNYKYFDFNSDSYEADTKEQQIFANGKRGAMSDVTYERKNDGRIEAMLDGHKIFQLTMLEEKNVKENTLDEYGSNIVIEGKVYESKLRYLANLHKVQDLVSSNAYDTLEEFVEEYKSKVFEGSLFSGLTFGEGNTLRQRIENNFSNAGTYSIEKIDNKNILFINPINTKRYGKNSCYILDFSRVWKAECHLKETVETLKFYDRAVYEDVLEYMQNNFTNISIAI